MILPQEPKGTVMPTGKRRYGISSLLRFTAAWLISCASLLVAFPAQASTTTAVGTIPGNFSVTPTGAATYAIPITLPRGSGGLTPSIALIYNSQSGSGAAGWGWTLAGLSAITRCNRTIDDDGVTQAVQLQSTDDYCLDGQKLIQKSDGTYDTEIQQFDRITAVSGTNGPDHFEVQTPDGRTYEYGNTTDSRILATGTSTVRAWALDRVTDANTNYYNITYQNNDTTTGDYWPLSIQYSGNTKHPSSPLHTITFAWTPRSDATVQTLFLHGTLISQTQLLSTITVKYNGNIAFTYTLGYQTDAGTGRNQLSQVQECAPDNSGSCFPTTQIQWQNGAAGWQGDQSTNVNLGNAAEAQAGHLMDVNGDGIMDLVYPNTVSGTTDWWVMFGQPSGGLGTPVDTGITADPTYYPYALAINYNGDGRTSLLVPEANGAWQVLAATGSEATDNIFTATATNLSTPGNNTQTNKPIYQGSVWAVDFYGHGLGDFVYTDGTKVYLAQNNGPGSGTRFGTFQSVYSESRTGILRSTSSSFVDAPMDFDGSGRGGALTSFVTTHTCLPDGCIPPPPTQGYMALLAAGSASNPFYQSMASIDLTNVTPEPMDTNGDGLTDLLLNTSDYQIEQSTGLGFVDISTTVPNDQTSDTVIADYYGDGRQEILVNENGSWSMIRINYDPGSQTFIPQVTNNISAPYGSLYVGGSLRIGSLNDNGLDDLVYAVQAFHGGSYAWHYKLHQGGAADLVTKVTDGLGNVFEPTYTSLASGSGVYTKGSGAVWPVEDVQLPMQVASSYQASDGIGGLYTESFTYAGAEAETEGRGFLGFASRTVTDSRSGVTVSDSYDQSYPWIGSILQETITQSNGKILSQTDNTYASNPASCAAGALCFAYPSGNDRWIYDATSGNLIETVGTANTFDNTYGNLIDTSTSILDETANQLFTTDTQTGYADYSGDGKYCISLPISAVVTKTTAQGSMQRDMSSTQTTADEDACRLTTQKVSQGTDNDASITGTATPVTSTYAYDDWGNPATVTVSASGLTSRSTTTDYATYYGEYPDKVTNALGQSATQSWNPALGVRLSVTDANLHATSFGYDDFGRETSATRADGTVANWTEPASTSNGGCPSGVECYAISTSESAGSTTIPLGTVTYDAMGRVIEQQKELLGGAVSSVETSYNALGQVSHVSKPSLGTAPVYWTNSTYDVLGRPIQITAPANQADNANSDVTTISYNGFSTTATRTAPSGPSSETTLTTTDALGEVTTKIDNPGTGQAGTSYFYDPFGDLISTTDADGQTTILTYDGLGHKLSMGDPNMGAWSYVVDALGEGTQQTDAKGQTITQSYDALGRLTSRMENGSQPVTDTWTWDTATNGIGLLASESDTNGFKKVYGYDSLSRPSEVDTTIPGVSSAYQVSVSYDSFGRVATLTYPVSYASQRFEVQYLYDPVSGALATVENTASGLVYWQAASGSSAVDAFGHLLGWTDGNNVSTVMGYDAATGAPLSIQSGLNASSAVQNLIYTWDGYGNLSERQDTNQSLSEYFQYDALNRLRNTTFFNPAATGLTVGYNYDGAGNILSQTQGPAICVSHCTYTTRSYAYDPHHPYAVASVTSGGSTVYSASYDGDGNMIRRNGYGLTWTTANLPESIASSTGSSTFNYDPEHQRYYQAANFNGTTTDTTYIGGLFEVIATTGSTQYRHNILADGEVIAVHTITGAGSAFTSYLHYDHLGSVDKITNDQGTVTQRMSFDAFGLRRDPSNWTYDLPPAQIAGLKSITDRGYTFQEELDDVSLVDMNGRVYDPSVGRFISADPTVPAPFFTQAFNRYSYVNNSPLEYIDPSGFCPSNGNPLYLGDCPTFGTPFCVGSGPCVFDSQPPPPPTNIPLPNGPNGPSPAPIPIPNPVPLPNPAPAPPTPPAPGSSPVPGGGGGNSGKYPWQQDPCQFENCAGDNMVLTRINSTDGWQTWNYVCFGCSWASTPSFDPQERFDPGRSFDAKEAARKAAANVPGSPGGGPIHLKSPLLGTLGTTTDALPWAPTLASGLESLALKALGVVGLALSLSGDTQQQKYLNHYTTSTGQAAIEEDQHIISLSGPTGNIYFTPDIYASASQAARALQITVPAGYYMVPLQNVEPISGYGVVPNGTGQEIIVNHPVSIKGSIWVPIPP